MKLVIREYLSMLKESGELDTMLPDLLMSMNITPTSKPGIGTRQYGVDLEAVGIDKEDNKKKIFLFVIKQGDFDRDSWDTGKQAIRPTLNEIKDVYIKNITTNQNKNKIKKIIVCCNGEIKQNVKPNWDGYVSTNSNDKMEYEFWGADKLAELVTEYFLNEFLFPSTAQKQMRKTLALVDSTEYDLSDFFELIDFILNQHSDIKKQRIKNLRLLNLCLNILYHWSKEAGNIKHSFVASERLLLKVWNWYITNYKRKSDAILNEVAKINQTRFKIWYDYVVKVSPNFSVRDGLYGYGKGADEIEYPLLVFEQIGIIGLIGLDFYYAFIVNRKQEEFQTAVLISDFLEGLITNNNISFQPQYDGHITEINLALLLLFQTGKHDSAKEWIKMIVDRILVGFRLYGFFPVFDDSYDTLMDVKLKMSQASTESSTMIYNLLEWSVVLEDEELYNYILAQFRQDFPNIDLQLWYPDKEIENILYEKNALQHNGTMFTTKLYELSFNEFKNQVIKHFSQEEKPKELSFIKTGFPIIGLIASRHLRTPVFPFYWRTQMKEITN